MPAWPDPLPSHHPTYVGKAKPYLPNNNDTLCVALFTKTDCLDRSGSLHPANLRFISIRARQAVTYTRTRDTPGVPSDIAFQTPTTHSLYLDFYTQDYIAWDTSFEISSRYTHLRLKSAS